MKYIAHGISLALNQHKIHFGRYFNYEMVLYDIDSDTI